MPKTKLDEHVKRLKDPFKQQDDEVRAILAKRLAYKGVKTSDTAHANFLEFKNIGTYRNKKASPGGLTLGELRRIVRILDLTSEEVGKMMGCKQ